MRKEVRRSMGRKKEKLPPNKWEGASKPSTLWSLPQLLALYHTVRFQSEKGNIYSTEIQGSTYRVIVKERKSPPINKPSRYLFQVEPQKVYISSLYPSGDFYLLENGGVIATARLQEDELILEFRSFGRYEDLKKLLQLLQGDRVNEGSKSRN